MWQAVTSIVLILGQLALACAVPLYVCTSADGTQRLEWGECECLEADHGHELLTAEACGHELDLAEPPCQCEHRPLSEGTQVVSRCEHDTRANLLVLFAEVGTGELNPVATYLSSSCSTSPRGHTALADRFSVCLRC